MPHIVVEYTDNLGADADIPGLLKCINEVMLAQRDAEGAKVYPIGGLRTRAVALSEYRIADGEGDYAFIHVALRIGAGRSAGVEARTCEDLFLAMKAHLAPVFAARLIALSMELSRSPEENTWKHNNLHAHFRAASA